MNSAITISAAIAAAAILVAYRFRVTEQPYEPVQEVEPIWGDATRAGEFDTIPQEGDAQTTGLVMDAFVALTPATYMTGNTDTSTANANVGAFLDMIAYAEGTAGPDGYRTMFGYRYFDSFADHPRQVFSFVNSKGQQLKTSAAGRYQFLASTWDELKQKLGLQDFSPASQDAGAIELIRQRGALNDVRAGRIVDAIAKVRTIWASLPGAGYSQPERNISNLIAAYQSAGGAILTA